MNIRTIAIVIATAVVQSVHAEMHPERLASIKAESISHVIVAWSDPDAWDIEKGEPAPISELFRITNRIAVVELLAALAPTNFAASEGASFSGYLPKQYFIGTNGDVVLETTVYMDGNVFCGKRTSFIDGRLVEDYGDAWHAFMQPNRDYTRRVTTILHQEIPTIFAKYDKQFEKLGGVTGALGLSAGGGAQQAVGENGEPAPASRRPPEDHPSADPTGELVSP